MKTFYPDASLENSDWTKKSWDLPDYKSVEFMKAFPDLDAFRKLPIYKWAEDKGLIFDDEWTGVDLSVPERRDGARLKLSRQPNGGIK